MKKLILLLFIPIVFGCDENKTKVTFVKIGNQIWSDENLSVDMFRNGDKIKQSKNIEDWFKYNRSKTATWCYYKFDENYSHLGKLYNYYSISDSRNLAPKGWEVASFEDYLELISFIDKNVDDWGSSYAGQSLKKSKISNWSESNDCKLVDTKFNAIPAGSLVFGGEWLGGVETARYWAKTDWEKVLKTVDWPESQKLKLLNDKGKRKSFVVRLENSSCSIDFDDDPNEYGYHIRLVKSKGVNYRFW